MPKKIYFSFVQYPVVFSKITTQLKSNRRKIMNSSTKDKAEGKKDQVKGKVKETSGKAVGNEELEAKGKGENLKGKAQEKAGDVKKAGGK